MDFPSSSIFYETLINLLNTIKQIFLLIRLDVICISNVIKYNGMFTVKQQNFHESRIKIL